MKFGKHCFLLDWTICKMETCLVTIKPALPCHPVAGSPVLAAALLLAVHAPPGGERGGHDDIS